MEMMDLKVTVMNDKKIKSKNFKYHFKKNKIITRKLTTSYNKR